MTKADALGLDELEVDALTELANIGVSRAALNLRELVGQEVVLSVPSLAVLTRAEAAAHRSSMFATARLERASRWTSPRA